MHDTLRTMAHVGAAAALVFIAYRVALKPQPRLGLEAEPSAAKSPSKQALHVKAGDTAAIAQLKAQLAAAQQAGLGEKMSDLELRLHALEAAKRPHDEPGKEPDEAATKPKPGTINEADLARYMDDSLKKEPDPASTAQAKAQAEQSVLSLDDVSVEELSCGKRFCRATFAGIGDEPPSLAGIYGMPPFANQGFTVEAPDGKVAIYFTRPGESLGDVRTAALAAR